MIGVAFGISFLAVIGIRGKALRLLKQAVCSKGVMALAGLILLGISSYAYWVRPHSPLFQAGHALGGRRGYREFSLANLATYLSPLILWSGIGGWFHSLWLVLLRQRMLFLTPLIVVFGGYGCLYIWNPSISPDHFWAIRRFVPVIIPGFVFFAFWGFSQVLKKAPMKWETGILAGLTAFLTFFTVLSGKPIFLLSEDQTLFVQLRDIAEKVKGQRVAFAVDGPWLTPLMTPLNSRLIVGSRR